MFSCVLINRQIYLLISLFNQTLIFQIIKANIKKVTYEQYFSNLKKKQKLNTLTLVISFNNNPTTINIININLLLICYTK